MNKIAQYFLASVAVLLVAMSGYVALQLRTLSQQLTEQQSELVSQRRELVAAIMSISSGRGTVVTAGGNPSETISAHQSTSDEKERHSVSASDRGSAEARTQSSGQSSVTESDADTMRDFQLVQSLSAQIVGPYTGRTTRVEDWSAMGRSLANIQNEKVREQVITSIYGAVNRGELIPPQGDPIQLMLALRAATVD